MDNGRVAHLKGNSRKDT